METTSERKHTWLWRAAWLILTLGLLAGFIALLAPLGIWLGLWEFPTGFAILRFIVPFTGWIAMTALAAGLLLAVLGRTWRTGRARLFLLFGLLGALAAGIAWYIPNSFQAPEGQSYPPIHDISTDTADPPRFVDVLPLRADAANTAEYGRSQGMTPERLAQLQREAYPDIQPLVLDAPPQEVFERALRAVDELGWELVAAAPGEGRIEAVDTTFWFRFKDDVVIRLRPENGGTRVDARSVSRVGRGDVGTNARRLREFLAELQDD